MFTLHLLCARRALKLPLSSEGQVDLVRTYYHTDCGSSAGAGMSCVPEGMQKQEQETEQGDLRMFHF